MNEQNEIAALKKELAELVKEADNQRAADARIFDLCVENYPHVSNDCPTEFEVECAFKYFRDRAEKAEAELADLRAQHSEFERIALEDSAGQKARIASLESELADWKAAAKPGDIGRTLESRIASLEAALRDCRLELQYCSDQLTAHGFGPPHPDGSVPSALRRAAAALAGKGGAL